MREGRRGSGGTRTGETRPIWRRVGRQWRDAAYRVGSVVERIVRRDTALQPPLHLRLYYYGTWRPDAFVHGCEVARAELTGRGLRPEHRVLDIGCGVGNLAVGLLGYLRGGYDGVDIHREAIDWCRRAITPKHPDFRFHLADLASRAYNPRGQVAASAYGFPFPDRTFDFIFLSSVFTHMMPDAVEHYLGEIARLLVPGGTCVASYYLLNDETRTGVDRGLSFMSFGVQHPSGLCRLNNAAVPEAAVALDEGFVRRVHDHAGLSIRDVRRGRWWNGGAHDQDVLTVIRCE